MLMKYDDFKLLKHKSQFNLQIYGADGSLLRAESRRGRGKGRGGGAVSILSL